VDPQNIRRIVLTQSKRANVGHIGSALSVSYIVAVVFGSALRVSDPHDPDRDRFVMAKGHAALAVYAALSLRGWVSQEMLDGFCTDGSELGVHPERSTPGVDFSTGSLGQGLPMAVGAALAGRLQSSNRRAFALLSDAECNEGSVWEAVMFAAQHQLSNLVAMVDANGQQALGSTRDIINLSPLADRWAAFGWDVRTVNGHDCAALCTTLDSLDYRQGPPHVLIAETIFGKGVSFMERQLKWHYLPMTDEEVASAMREGGGQP